MPWTRKQVKYLLSAGSPLSGEQQEKMKGELHANPEMGHKQKMKAETAKYKGESHSYSHKRSVRKVLSRYAR